jgi:aminoglycoside N3'-acetyltransferase
MPLPTTTSADLDRHLHALDLSNRRDIVVHSRLISFGYIEGGAMAVYEALRRAVGSEGTIAVPTYTLELGKDHPYDPNTSSSMEAGALSEYVRRLPGAVRSRCPLHNHAAIGPAASLLADRVGCVSLGVGSDFDAFRQAGFSLLLLGCGFHEGATFVHHVEALVGVPYRKWTELPRTVVVDGVQRELSVRYYGRTSAAWTEDFDKVRAAMEAAALLRAADCPFGRSFLVRLDDLETFVTEMLNADPHAVVSAVDGAGHG